MWPPVRSVPGTRPPVNCLLVSYTPCLCLIALALTSPWTSSQVCPPLQVTPPSSWWWTDSPKCCTLYLCPSCPPPGRWWKPCCFMCFASIVFQGTWCWTGAHNSSHSSGRLSALSSVPVSASRLDTIPSRTVRRSDSTRNWRPVYEHLQTSDMGRVRSQHLTWFCSWFLPFQCTIVPSSGNQSLCALCPCPCGPLPSHTEPGLPGPPQELCQLQESC